MRITAIHQPDFIPYLGFFHRLVLADYFIVLDHVQFVKSNNSWTHRDKIKTRNGAKWLTISVEKPNRSTAINQVKLSNQTKWRNDHINLIRENYRNSLYFKEVFPDIVQLYSQKTDSLISFNFTLLEWVMKVLNIKINIVFSSRLNPSGQKNDLLVDLLNKINSTHYLSGIGAKNYFNPLPFKKNNIEVIWQKFSPPRYTQINGDFIENLSIIDLLFNCGQKGTKNILENC